MTRRDIIALRSHIPFFLIVASRSYLNSFHNTTHPTTQTHPKQYGMSRHSKSPVLVLDIFLVFPAFQDLDSLGFMLSYPLVAFFRTGSPRSVQWWSAQAYYLFSNTSSPAWLSMCLKDRAYIGFYSTLENPHPSTFHRLLIMAPFLIFIFGLDQTVLAAAVVNTAMPSAYTYAWDVYSFARCLTEAKGHLAIDSFSNDNIFNCRSLSSMCVVRINSLAPYFSPCVDCRILFSIISSYASTQ